MLLCLLLCFPKEHKQKLILLFLRLFLLALVEHISQVFHRAPSPTQDDYISRTSGEVPSQIFPNIPILKERAIYEKNCHNQDKRALKDSCEKDFPTHSGLTPGLYLMTCGCKQRSVYGFSMMLTHKSPSNPCSSTLCQLDLRVTITHTLFMTPVALPWNMVITEN